MKISERAFSKPCLFATLAAIGLATIACGSTVVTDSTIPSRGLEEPTSVSIIVDLVAPPGTATVKLNGVSYSDSIGFVRVPVGAQTISGSFTGSSLVLNFGGYVGLGGVPTGFIASMSGPSPVVTNCSIKYTGNGTGVQTFTAVFQVATATSGHC